MKATFDKWGEVSGGAPIVVQDKWPNGCAAIQAVDGEEGFQIQTAPDRIQQVARASQISDEKPQSD